MSATCKRLLAALLGAAVALLAAAPAAAQAQGGQEVTLGATLSGRGGVPPGATGQVTMRVRGGRLCYDLRWSGMAPAAAHVHRGAGGANGQVAVPLFATDAAIVGWSEKRGCVRAAASLLARIAANPAAYYVDLHSPQFPQGAVRGRLAVVAPPPAAAATGLAAPGRRASPQLGLLLVAMSAAAAALLLGAAAAASRRPARPSIPPSDPPPYRYG